MGLVDPARVLTNRGARPGDRLILTKGLGVGVLGGAFKRGELEADGYAALIGSTTKLNTLGALLPDRTGVHAVTDVTGFGLLGHALEMARGGGVTIEIEADALPLIVGVRELAEAGRFTGASGRNWASYGQDVRLPDDGPPWLRDLLTDPQTSGGLLIAVAEDQAETVLDLARREGFSVAAEIGRVTAGDPLVVVRG